MSWSPHVFPPLAPDAYYLCRHFEFAPVVAISLPMQISFYFWNKTCQLTRWKSNSCSCRAFANCTSGDENAFLKERERGTNRVCKQQHKKSAKQRKVRSSQEYFLCFPFLRYSCLTEHFLIFISEQHNCKTCLYSLSLKWMLMSSIKEHNKLLYLSEWLLRDDRVHIQDRRETRIMTYKLLLVCIHVNWKIGNHFIKLGARH